MRLEKVYTFVLHKFPKPSNSDPLSVGNFLDFLSLKNSDMAFITDLAVLFVIGFTQRYFEKTSITKSR